MKKVITNLNNFRGITLIALIITIIILLILLGIIFSSVIGKTSFVEKITNATSKSEDAKIEENMILEDYEKAISDNLKNQGEAEKLLAEMFSFSPKDSNWNVNNIKEALDYLYNN